MQNELLVLYDGKTRLHGKPDSEPDIEPDPVLPENDSLTNIVFMGMGEPLDNVDELFKVLEILTGPVWICVEPEAYHGFNHRCDERLETLFRGERMSSAVSLHSPYPMERLSLMPVEKAFPAREVIDLIKQYDFSHQRRVSLSTLF